MTADPMRTTLIVIALGPITVMFLIALARLLVNKPDKVDGR
jgi:hypothetical protein